MWKFNGTWTWFAGYNDVGGDGLYGPLRQVSDEYYPPARTYATGKIDGNSYLWIFGGSARNSSNQWTTPNDLWKILIPECAKDQPISTTSPLSTSVVGSITTGKVTTSRITSGRITSGRVTSGRITSGQITSNEVTSGSLTTKSLTSNALTTSALTSASLTTSPVTTSFVTTAKITTGQPELDRSDCFITAVRNYGTGADAETKYGVINEWGYGNFMGSRAYFSYWNDEEMNIWVFGGDNLLNDLWVYSRDQRQWAWMGNGGPSGREKAMSVVGPKGEFYLFGGRSSEGFKR